VTRAISLKGTGGKKKKKKKTTIKKTVDLFYLAKEGGVTNIKTEKERSSGVKPGVHLTMPEGTSQSGLTEEKKRENGSSKEQRLEKEKPARKIYLRKKETLQKASSPVKRSFDEERGTNVGKKDKTGFRINLGQQGVVRNRPREAWSRLLN